MPIKNILVALTLSLFMFSGSAVLADRYHRSSGSRVVYPDQNGLYQTPSTQIGEGTMSRSAQGNYERSGALPVTPLGPSVLPGDSSRSDLPGQRSVGSGLRSTQLGPHVNPGDASRTDINRGNIQFGLQRTQLGPHVNPGDSSRTDLQRPRTRVQQTFRPAPVKTPVATYEKQVPY